MISFLLTTKIGRAISALIIIAAAVLGFKVWLSIHDASIIKAEAAKCLARIENMVSQAEVDALAAVLAQEQAKRAAAEAMTNEAQKRATALLRAKEEQDVKIKALIDDAKKSPGLTYPSNEDMTWIEKSR